MPQPGSLAARVALFAAGGIATAAIAAAAKAGGFVDALPDIRIQPIAETLQTSDDDYPPESRRAGQQGTVRLLITVSSTGRVTACSIYRSSGAPPLDARSCSLAIERFRFLPARRDGIPVEDTAILPVEWRLQD